MKSASLSARAGALRYVSDDGVCPNLLSHQFQIFKGQRFATMASVLTRKGVRESPTRQCSAAEGGAYAFWVYFASLVDVLETGVISVCWLSEAI